ncbi:hypothetical protein KPMX200_40588 [Klebsiella pneumoniae]|nr:hypothetical protein KPMX200_40588 [Klebsiella pneumoniae]
MSKARASPGFVVFGHLPGGTARGRTTWRVGSGSPGEALLPTPGMSAVPHAKKKPVLAYELFLKYGGEGGIDSLRSPLRGSPLAGLRSVQLALPVVEPRSGVLIPPCGEYKRKEPVLAYRLSSRIWR